MTTSQMDFSNLLNMVVSENNANRMAAEQQIKYLVDTDKPQLIHLLVGVIGSSTAPIIHKRLASILLKKELTLEANRDIFEEELLQFDECTQKKIRGSIPPSNNHQE